MDILSRILTIIATVVTVGCIVSIITALCGCHAYVSVDKRPNLVVPIYNTESNLVDWVVVDQGYEVKYSKWGFNTEIESMSAELTTNKTVNFTLGGLHSTASLTNNIQIKVEDLISVIKLFRSADTAVICPEQETNTVTITK